MNNGYYITSTGRKVILTSDDNTIYICGMNIIELVIHEGVVSVRCWSNQLTELIIPDSVEMINCRFNNLTELIVPDGCVVVCDDSVNQINRTMYNRSNRIKNILK